MALGKRLINTGVADAVCSTDSVDPFGDGNGVALYSLDYDASDASGLYDGTPTNVEFGVGGKINYGARFNGSSSYIDVSNFPNSIFKDSTNGYTVSLWFKRESGTSSSLQAFFGTALQTKALNVYFRQSDNLFQIENGSASAIDITGGFTYDDGNWHHFVLTDTKVYIDGSEIMTYTGNYPSTFTDGQIFHIGSRHSSSRLYYGGDIDQVRIFSKALNQTEVDTLYAETACVYDCTTDDVNYPFSDGTNVEAYYKLDNDATDETGSYDGTESNIEYRFGRYGQAAVFSANGYISGLPTVQNTSGGFSVSMWFNTTVNPSVQQTMLGGIKEQGSNDSVFAFKMLNDGYSKLYLRGTDGTLYILADTVDATDGNWHHLVATVSSSSGVFYVDGQQVDSATISNNITVDNLLIAAENNRSTLSPTNYFNGSIDQVRIYSTALTSSQVTQLYEEKQCYITKDAADPFGDSNSVALYEMENNANDTSGNGNNGTASNVTFTSTDPIRGTYEASFNGSSSRINISSLSLFDRSSFAISCWVKSTNVTSTGRIISHEDSGGSAIIIRGDDVVIDARDAGASASTTLTMSTTNNQWHHVCLVNDSNHYYLYLDGVEVDDDNYGYNPTTATAGSGHQLAFGYRKTNNDSYWSGDLDQVRIFDRVLDGTEAYQLYAEGARATGL